ncbi:peptide chain release factor N(5)-glutamine methyltransferase [Mangrovicella endophytica]|uniref:peptide chain release factor N(5)-glutamine methyltransferase n=1 Tax=Mangrovicella endophytica TaxID=2066697 RepID=UPI001FE162BA|nr:peptide chain release factor N(5)-glutamine methyltransferase [Mangrovicella endophytica]
MRQPAATIGETLAALRRRFAGAGLATPDLDARLLAAECFGLDRTGLMLRSAETADDDAMMRLQAMAERRLAGEPVHRILGRRFFFDHEFALSPATLEPRPDTEILVEAALPVIEAIIARRGACVFADIGTGTGAIAVSLLARCPAAVAVAIDISAEALGTACRNAEIAGVRDRFFPLLSDYLAAVGGPLDAVVSNPPYISTEIIRGLDREVREHDPLLALDGGSDGLTAYRTIAAQAPRCCSGGPVLLEIGAGQDEDVTRLFEEQGLYLAASADDLGGVTRVLHFEASDGLRQA